MKTLGVANGMYSVANGGIRPWTGEVRQPVVLESYQYVCRPQSGLNFNLSLYGFVVYSLFVR